jgi:hypothetical protein
LLAGDLLMRFTNRDEDPLWWYQGPQAIEGVLDKCRAAEKRKKGLGETFAAKRPESLTSSTSHDYRRHR